MEAKPYNTDLSNSHPNFYQVSVLHESVFGNLVGLFENKGKQGGRDGII